MYSYTQTNIQACYSQVASTHGEANRRLPQQRTATYRQQLSHSAGKLTAERYVCRRHVPDMQWRWGEDYIVLNGAMRTPPPFLIDGGRTSTAWNPKWGNLSSDLCIQ